MRRWTETVFPGYSYVPGKTPHPIRDPEGHSFGRPEPEVAHFDPKQWPSCHEFLFGVDLFNAGFYWESHEQWEAVWHALGRRGTIADFVKGLIKLSAAGVKKLEGRPNGVQRHARRAVELFKFVGRQHAVLCGLRLEDLIRSSTALADDVTCELPVLDCKQE